MYNIILILQVIFCIVLITLILLQSKGTGLGTTFGGDMGFYGTKRGAEKVLFILTIIFAVFFVTSSVAGLIFR